MAATTVAVAVAVTAAAAAAVTVVAMTVVLPVLGRAARVAEHVGGEVAMPQVFATARGHLLAMTVATAVTATMAATTAVCVTDEPRVKSRKRVYGKRRRRQPGVAAGVAVMVAAALLRKL